MLLLTLAVQHSVSVRDKEMAGKKFKASYHTDTLNLSIHSLV